MGFIGQCTFNIRGKIGCVSYISYENKNIFLGIAVKRSNPYQVKGILKHDIYHSDDIYCTGKIYRIFK